MVAVDLFNWYFSLDRRGSLCINGDACVIQMRHDAYVAEKKSYKSYKFIKKNDTKWKAKFPDVPERQFEFVHSCSCTLDNNGLCCTRESTYRLVAMDSFFERVPERKAAQLAMASM